MAETLTNLLDKFTSTWQAGKDARLFLECHAGQAWMHLHLHLSHPSPVKQHHRRPGPSRLRRRARREEARLAAANAATKETSNKKDTAEVAVQVDKTARVTCDAVQADHSSTAVLATHHHPAVEAVPKQPAAQAVVARQLPVAQAAFTAEQARPWLPHHHPVQDALCPDLHYGVAGFAPRHVSPDIGKVPKTS